MLVDADRRRIDADRSQRELKVQQLPGTMFAMPDPAVAVEAAPERIRWACAAFLLLLAVAVLSVGLYRIGFGIDVSDEGFYLSAPARYALGDVPFRDEFLNPHRMFDLVLWPVFELFPDVAVYELRAAWLFVQLACVVSLWSLFRRFAPGAVVGLACAATVFVPNLIWTPGYHVMGAFLFMLAWSLWLMGCLSKRRLGPLAGGAASGVAFAVAAVSYLPLLAAGFIPAVVLLAQLRGRLVASRATLASTAAQLTVLGILALVGAAVLVGSGLLPDWIDAQRRILGYGQYSSGIADKLVLFAEQIQPILPTLGGVAMCLAATLAACRSRSWPGRFAGSPVGIALLAAGPVVVGLFAVRPLLWPAADGAPLPWFYDMEASFGLAAASLGLHLGAWLARLAPGAPRAWEPNWGLVYFASFSGALILAGLFGVLSGQAYKTIFAIVPLTVSGLVLVYREFLATPTIARPAWRASAVVCGLAILLALPSYALRLSLSYNEGPVAEMREAFSHPRLLGIRASAQRVRAIETIASYVSEQVGADERILIEGDAPLFYYLTGMRPALDHSWSAADLEGALKLESLRKMIAAGRTPRVAIRFRPPAIPGTLSRAAAAELHPIHTFIERNYEPGLKIGVIEVWLRRGSSPPPARTRGSAS